MDRVRLVETLGLVSGGTFAIRDIQMVQWGRDVLFGFVHYPPVEDDAPEPPAYFNLIFRDCRELRYKVYAHIGQHEQGQVLDIADLAELQLGRGNHRRDANILTTHFAATISYGKVQAEMGDHLYDLTM